MPGIPSLNPPQGALGGGITPGFSSMGGLAPGGIRHSGLAPKGLGFFGSIPNPAGGTSTELSSDFQYGKKNVDHPLLVPGLTREEIDTVLAGGKMTDSIYRKAQDFAIERMKRGLSPFAGPTDLRLPLPPR